MVANHSESLARLLTSWAEDGRTVGRKEQVVLARETLRDDIAQAATVDGRQVNGPQALRDYLDELITELRRL